MNTYVPLFCKSNFSFLEGASHPGELVTACDELGLDALGLCDRDGVYGVVQAHKEAKELDIELILGAQVTVGQTLERATTINLYAMHRDGWANLCRLLTVGQRRLEKGTSRVTWSEVCEHADGLIGLWGGPGSLIGRAESEDEARRPGPGFASVAERLTDAFGDRLYAMVSRHRTPKDLERESRVRKRARERQFPLVAAPEVLYHSQTRRPLQDLLTCIDHGITIHEASEFTHPNAEHDLKAADAFADLYSDLPLAVERTREVAQRCHFELGDIHYRYPSQDLDDGETSADRLRALTLQGARERYDGDIPDDVGRQLEDELELIERLEYCGYFLGMKEIVDYCDAHDILCQGRGSAANSAVCYCLGITAVDPVRMDLLFERFISEERNEPPDIDLDIEHDRREEVIQWVYESYGRERAAMVANVIRYRPKSAIRDIGKALDIPATSLDRMAKMVGRSSYKDGPGADLLEKAGLDPKVDAHRQLLYFTGQILEFPRHLSIHPGGFVLGAEPVCEIVPIENGSMEDRTVIQWDKYDVEEMNLFKVDLLGLGALSQLHRCFDLIDEHYGRSLSMDTIPADDEATYDMICEADTVGVFQIESRAQMSMLPRLKPRHYYDLVVEVSIVRPGPITGEMVHPYLKRRAGEEPVTYPHPSLEPVLKKTLGVPLFQEQVMKLAVVAADYTPGEADQLRRDMGAWREDGRMERHREQMIERMLDKGIEQQYAERVFEQIRGFGSYGFPESHAASFALISYATSYIKCHYPAVFACGLLNSQPMGFYSPATIVEDARRHDVEVRPVDVTESRWNCTLEPVDGAEMPALRMGARFVKGLREEAWERVEAARRRQSFEGLEDFLRRTGLGEGDVDTLAEAGAFDGFDLTRREAIWLGRGLVRTPELPLELRDVVDEQRPALRGLRDFEIINWDYRTTQHSPRGHPLEPLRERLDQMGLPTAEEVDSAQDGIRMHYAGLVICRQRPSTGSGVVFMTLEDETGFANLVLWPDVYARYETIAKTQHFLGVTGEIQTGEGDQARGITHLIVESLWRPDLTVQPEHGGSHDFH
jgi:error-prone DNA polymerase